MLARDRLGALALASTLAFALSFTPGEPAKAQGFFNGGAFAPQRYRARDLRRGPSAPSFGFWWGGSAQPQRPPEDIYVSSPRYYTYAADAPAEVSLAPLAETRVATSGPIGAGLADNRFAAARSELESFSLRVLPEVGTALIAHYQRYPDYLWVEGDHVNSRAYAALAALQRADRFALAPEDYALDLPKGRAAPAGHGGGSDSLIRFELAFSARVLTYILDANRGRIDPNRLSGYHDFERKKIDLAARLVELAAAGDAGAYLDAQSPDNAPFRALRDKLETLRAADTPERIEIAEGTFLRPGGESPELANIVAAIRLTGSDALVAAHRATLDAYDGGSAYGEDLVALVESFQREKGLAVDGIVGQNTIRAMVPESNGDRIAKIELAMERLRWLPRDLGPRHVFINQPAFMATYTETGKEPLSMRIVVGQKSNQTYFFADKIEKVEYNPYWGVPRSIIVNEMLPQLYQDPSYLDRTGYEVTTATGQRVSSTMVDWGGVASKQVPINVRQPPGGGNALGRVKIMFPNAHAIYMHDTPQKHLFERESRAFSHGCVRLQKPREMAAAVLGKSVDYVDQRIAEGRNASEEITADIPVYVAYFTAWPESDGEVHFHDDMYGRDAHLIRAIEATSAVRRADS